MSDRAKRLNMVYDYVYEHCHIHNKGEFADAIGYARTYVSSAMNGNEKYLTPKLFKSICGKFEFFDFNYLLTGEGTLLLKEEKAEPQPAPANDQMSALVDSLIHTNRILEKVIADKDHEIQRMEEYAERQAHDFSIALESKKEEILLLKERIADLTSQLSAYQSSDALKNFPFSPGVADPKKDQTKNI